MEMCGTPFRISGLDSASALALKPFEACSYEGSLIQAIREIFNVSGACPGLGFRAWGLGFTCGKS